MVAQLVCKHGLVLNRCSTCHFSPVYTHRSLHANLNELLKQARPRLLRLASLNGVPVDLVDDVVQETFVEAWQHLENLREPERFAAWLDGICRNVCRRQARVRTNSSHEVQFPCGENETDLPDFDPPDSRSIDPSETLVHQDLQILLDRALGHLSEGARELIELCYLAELPQREVAQRLDISLGALELRLHRARRQLRQVLNGAMRTDATEFGLLWDEDESMGWQEVRRWCWLCGKQRVRGKFERLPSGIVSLRLRCPDCSKRYNTDITHSGQLVQMDGLHSFQSALKRGLQRASDYFTALLKERRCTVCKSIIGLRIVNSDFFSRPNSSCKLIPGMMYLSVDCPVCKNSLTDLTSVLLLNSKVYDFIINRPRAVVEPHVLATYGGQDVIQTRLSDLNNTEQLTIMTHPETLQVMTAL